MDFINNNQQYFYYTLGYIFFCAISRRFIDYFSELNNICETSYKTIRGKFDKEYNTNVKKHWENYKTQVKDLGSQRSWYYTLFFLSIILVIVNSFILAAFLNSVGNLQNPILLEPIQINYSHLIAAAIVIVEIGTGIIYYLGQLNQQQDEDNNIWAFFKYIALLSFISLLLVETIMWAKLSTYFDMPESLGFSPKNVFTAPVNYFLAFLGIGFTFAEFSWGFYMTKYGEYKGDSLITNYSRYFIFSIMYIVLYLIPSLLLMILSYLTSIIIQVIKITVIPGIACLEKVHLIKET